MNRWLQTVLNGYIIDYEPRIHTNGPGVAVGHNQIIDYEPRMDTNGHELLTTKHTKQTKMPRRRAVNPLKDLSEQNEF